MADRVVLLHGFTQTAQSWPRELIDALLATGRSTVAIDAPGHGFNANVRTTAAAEAALLARHNAPADWIGYSMGGRLALHVAVHTPHAVDRLVLIGATPGIEDDAERAARRRSDEELADSIERDGVEAFLERWLANPLFATLSRDNAFLDHRLENTAQGLASSLRTMGAGAQESLWDRVGALAMPVLLVTGALDEKFTEIAHRMAAAIGANAVVETVQNAGHAVHLERPLEVAQRIASFLGVLGHASTNATESAAP